jgi:hypothetical protein
MIALRFIFPFISFLQSRRRPGSTDPEQGAGAPEARGSQQHQLGARTHIDVTTADAAALDPHKGKPMPGEPPENPGAEDDKDKVVPKYRYTPLVSGIAIPFCILLQIPGVTEHWYIRTDGNQIVEIRANPAILDVGICLSMASAVLASMCLITRFLEKRVLLSTILCLIFLTFHGKWLIDSCIMT